MNELATLVDMKIVTEYAIEYGTGLLGALAIFVFGRILVKICTHLLSRALLRAKLDETLVSFGSNIAYTLGLAFVVIAALGQLGVQTTSLAAIFAAAGLAIGLSLQGSLSNLAAGVMIIAFRPFKLGDFVEAAGTAGIVRVSVFSPPH